MGASLQEIIRWLGARDVSTVSHGVRRAESRLKEGGGGLEGTLTFTYSSLTPFCLFRFLLP